MDDIVDAARGRMDLLVVCFQSRALPTAAAVYQGIICRAFRCERLHDSHKVVNLLNNGEMT
jgi:hypothetical protein